MQWLNLIGVAGGGLLIGMSTIRMKVEAEPSRVSEFVLAFGVVDLLINGAVVAHKLGLL